MKIVAYLRVSTDQQAEKGLGLEVQKQAIRTWATRNGHRIAEWCSDEGVSGGNGLDTREALATALATIKGGGAVGLVVYHLDRLARDLIVQETLLAEVKRLGGQVFSTATSESAYLLDDPDDPSRKLIRQVLGAISEYEKSMISLRLRSGRRLKSQRGGYAYGSPPMGYRSDEGFLVPDEREGLAVDRARELRAEGKSLREIAEVLEREGHTSKRGGPWHPTTLGRTLARTAPSVV